MDDRIYPGLLPMDKRIIKYTKEYTGVKVLNNRHRDTVACKNLILLLTMEFCTHMNQKQQARVAGFKDHSSLHHVRNNYFHLYGESGSLYYRFCYINVKAQLRSKNFFTIDEFLAESIKRGCERPEDVEATRKAVLEKDGHKTKLSNPFVVSLIKYMQRQGVSSPEIENMIRLRARTLFNKLEDPKRMENYFTYFDTILKHMIHLTTNQIK